MARLVKQGVHIWTPPLSIETFIVLATAHCLISSLDFLVSTWGEFKQ